jgi:hypothetical protein
MRVLICPTLALVWLLLMMAGCADRAPTTKPAASFDTFAEQFMTALSDTAAAVSNPDSGSSIGVDADFRIEPNGADDVCVMSFETFRETGRHVGKGPTKQNEWDKFRGTATITFARSADSESTFTVHSIAFAGTLEHKPLSLYTDATQIARINVNSMPGLRELVIAAMARLTSAESAAS